MSFANVLKDLETMVKDRGMRIEFNGSMSHLQQVNSTTAELAYEIKGGRDDHDFYLVQQYSHSSKLNVPDELRQQIVLNQSFYPLESLQGYVETSDYTSLRVTCAKGLSLVAEMFIRDEGHMDPELDVITVIEEIREVAREGGYKAVFTYLLDFMEQKITL
ncbi:MAG: hypothetical protein IH934_06970 [Nanoarchaeota archaeon]|nr:hypothetical protein [Nanoarchaeota archaeon]